MSDSADKNLITSKEVLDRTGISRATLNNYIKMGIIPRPIVQRPKEGMRGVKKIGYFPSGVLERIETVKRLKREGHSMAVIARRVKALPMGKRREDLSTLDALSPSPMVPERGKPPQVYGKGLTLTLEDISFPAYLLNFNFEIEWVNPEAEVKLFRQEVSLLGELESRNIFKLLFHWELHNHVRNWKDLLTLHMSFAKSKFSRSWIEKLYRGITGREIGLLEKIYDNASTFPIQGIKYTDISLLLEDGTSDPYKVYSIFFKEGIFFIYVPRGLDRLPVEPIELFISRGLSFSTMRDSRGFPSNLKSAKTKTSDAPAGSAGGSSSERAINSSKENGSGQNGLA